MRHLSVTYDEPRHFQYGQNILNLDSTRFDDSKMPVSALNALPSVVARHLAPGPLATALARLEAGRYVTVAASLLVALCVFAWARRLYGVRAGLLALTLYAFDPNLLTHAQLVTTDIYAAGTIAFALFMFWRYLQRGTRGAMVGAALALGLAQIAKYTALVLLPLFVLIAVGFHGRAIWRQVRRRSVADLRRRSASLLVSAAVFLVVVLAVVNAGFLFNGSGTSLAGYTFRSDTFREIQAAAGPVGAIPVPLPYPYLEGLDWVVQRERTGEGYGNLYLFGEVRKGVAFPGYYFYATLYKVPLATQALVVGAVLAYVIRRRQFDFLRNEWVIACPVVFFTLYFNFFYRAQIGFRFYLIVFPMLYVFAGSLVKDGVGLSRRATAALAGGLAYLAISVLSYYPHFLPYMNELVPNRTLAYTVLADSNLDWGQHVWYFEQYMKAHPQAIVEPEKPTAGTILVGVNMLTGVAGTPDTFRWLRDNFTPVGHVAHAVLVYEVSAAELDRVLSRPQPAPAGR